MSTKGRQHVVRVRVGDVGAGDDIGDDDSREHSLLAERGPYFNLLPPYVLLLFPAVR